MQLHLLAILFTAPLLEAALPSAEGAVDQVSDQTQEAAEENQEQLDRQISAGSDAMAQGDFTPNPMAACSCDCCESTKLKPHDFVTTSAGELITSICAKHAEPPGEEESETCPAQCASAEDGAILHAAKGESLDYSRYCHYSCRPMSDALGSKCVMYDKELASQASTEGGNGKEIFPAPLDGVGSGLGEAKGGPMNEAEEEPVVGVSGTAEEEDEAEEVKKAVAKEEKAVDDAKAKKQADAEITYDMRKMVAERMRAEAGAMVSAGASSAEQTRLNVWKTKDAVEEAKKARETATKMAAQVEGDVAGVEAAKTTAQEAERKTRNLLSKSKNFAASMMKDIKKLTEEEIKKEVAPWVQTRAEYRAEGKHLDKPEGWKKVVAARAADPYQRAVTAAVQRTAEYQRMANDFHNKALAAQQQANFLMPHVNLMEAHGDPVGAAVEKRKMLDLVKQAKDLQQQGQGYWTTANEAQGTISKWQEAGAQAAAYASWEYDNSETAFK